MGKENIPAIEISAGMLDAGEQAILEEVGGADLGGFFSARDLAEKVFAAMKRSQCKVPRLPR